MLAAAAVLWFIADASFERLAVSPPGVQNGAAAHAGLEITQTLNRERGLVLSIAGRAGAAYVDAWQPLFEGAAEVAWHETIGVHAGARHDDRLRREGALADFRDPTGRLFFGASVMPFHRRFVAAGATFDYERAMPGAGRLPSGTRITAVVRFRGRG